MIAFRIKLNGRKMSTAGLPGYHVVSAIATSVLRRPDTVGKVRRRRSAKPEVKFEIGGLSTSPDGAREHVSWTSGHALKPGDRLLLEIVDTDSADEPLHRGGGRHNKASQRAGRRPARR